MRAANGWKDYELIDATQGNRLERWADTLLVRPDPQIVWQLPQTSNLWNRASAVYHRSASGGGSWEQRREMPQRWKIAYQDCMMYVSPTGFKHTGVFPEQAVNWDLYRRLIQKRMEQGQAVRVLNLFGYTGGATLACAAQGAQVCHVDAAKGMVAWARENQAASGLADRPIRWIVDDCAKFAAREIRRGVRYDVLIMDPPSYGRGPGGEIWKLEQHIDALIALCVQLLSSEPLLVAVNSYTAGLSPSVMEYILKQRVGRVYGGITCCDEIGLSVTATGGVIPCGATALWLESGQEHEA